MSAGPLETSLSASFDSVPLEVLDNACQARDRTPGDREVFGNRQPELVRWPTLSGSFLC